MCGIFGGAPELISKDAERLLRHRGPDQQGRVVVTAKSGRTLVVGQARLSVVYKEDVPTPMTRGDAVIAFNGEIYNWVELRTELEAKGHRFDPPHRHRDGAGRLLGVGPRLSRALQRHVRDRHLARRPAVLGSRSPR